MARGPASRDADGHSAAVGAEHAAQVASLRAEAASGESKGLDHGATLGTFTAAMGLGGADVDVHVEGDSSEGEQFL
jgi:hypothetical protein